MGAYAEASGSNHFVRYQWTFSILGMAFYYGLVLVGQLAIHDVKRVS